MTSRRTAAILSGLVLTALPFSAQQATLSAQPAAAAGQTPAAVQAPAQATVQPASTTAKTVSAYAYSKVRIVRLSEVKGVVQMDRNTGRGFEDAVTNLPIIENGRLATGVGVAEVEFEDNSSLRITPGSQVEFPRLELLPSGAKATTVKMVKGMAYISLANTKGNEFTVLFGEQTMHLQPSSHIRLELEPAGAKVAVLEGAAQVEGPAGVTEIGKKKTALFNVANQNQPTVAKNVATEQFDGWDKQSAEYHQHTASMSAFGNSSNSYGANDMQYYGSFVNAGGCGSMWRPYFASAAWSPYGNGAFAWYPGAGYSWVSPYPWGWTPYHSGSWSYCDGTGWGWQPGSTWNGLSNAPSSMTTLNSRNPIRLPHAPTEPPIAGRSTLMAVSSQPLTTSTLDYNDKFVFRKDSAGLGVPRGNLGRLDKFSQEATLHGSASTMVHSPAASSQPESGRAGSSPGHSSAGISGAASSAGSPGISAARGSTGAARGAGVSSGGHR